MKFETEIENDNNIDPCDIGGEIYNAVKDMTIGTVRIMQKHDDLSPVNHLYVCLSAAAGALSVAAKIMSIPDVEKEELGSWAGLPPSREAILAASLLVARSTVPVAEGTVIEYSPANLKPALDAMAKVLGNPDHSMLAPDMVRSAARQSSPAHFHDNTEIVIKKAGIHTQH